MVENNNEIDEETDVRPPAPGSALHEDDEATIVRAPAPQAPLDEDDEATILRPAAPEAPLDEDDEATIVRPLQPAVDDDDEATIVRPLRAPQSEADEPDDLDERTTVVDRGAPDGLDERTTVVDRSAKAPDEDADERTKVVDRSASAPDDGTIVVDRGTADRGAVDDGTVVVSRDNAGPKRPSTPGQSSRRSNKRRITLPPVEPGFGREAVDAAGPGAVSTYEPRLIPDLPEAVSEVEPGPDATRADAPSMPSVVKRSRRMGFIGVVGFALACVLSVVGLAIFATIIFGG